MQTAPWKTIIEHLLFNSDTMTKAVLALLIGMSIVCWSVFLYRFIATWYARRRLSRAVKTMKTIQTVEDLHKEAAREIGTPIGFFISKTITAIPKHTDGMRSIQQKISTSHWAVVQENLEYALDIMVRDQESGLWVLSVCAAVSPLLGLFGTVWGLVGAFWGIGQAQSADIAYIAPGIAQALVTTLAGLMIAVPALFMHSILRWQLREYEHHCERLSDAVRIVVQRHLVW